MHTPPDDAIPRFRTHLVASAIDDDTLVIHSEARRVVVRGASVAAVGRLVDGVRDVSQIATTLGEHVGPGAVARVLNALARAGHLEFGLARAGNESSFWQLLAGPTADAQVHAMQIALHVPGGDFGPLQHALAQAGVRVGLPATLHVVVYDDPLDPRWVTKALAATGPVLLCRMGGTQPTVGPLLDEQAGPCACCVAHALARNRPVPRFLRERLGQAFSVPAPVSATSLAAASGLLAMSIAQFATGDRSLRRALCALNLRNLQTTLHAVPMRPQCPHCGDARWMQSQAERAPVLQPRIASHREDGGHRICSAEQTLAAYWPLVSPLTGVVNYLHPMPGRHSAVRKVYVSGYQVCPQEWPRDNGFDKICAGKGRTDAQAQASALCEAIERASSVWQGDEAMQWATRAELGPRAVSLDTLQGFSARQFAHREAINASTSDRRRQVPLPFADDIPIAWTPAWSLTGGDRCLVPLAYCFAEAPPTWGSHYCVYNPNGTAAGNCLEEAVLQGLLELVERDATALWWYQRVSRPALDLACVADDPFVAVLLADYATNGWRVHVLDLTHDLGIPVYAAVARHDALDKYAVGFGCHLQSRIAVSRALTELNQMLDTRADAHPPWDRQLLPDAPFIAPTGLTQQLHAHSTGDDLCQDIDVCLGRLATAGLEAMVVDKTRPDFGLAVAQVLVPGLRHFWPRFGPGRLYDVPVALGWKMYAAEEALNPAPLFL
jgi:bacteriocin biosynthesis cyclodehydratase domain-containing protein